MTLFINKSRQQCKAIYREVMAANDIDGCTYAAER